MRKTTSKPSPRVFLILAALATVVLWQVPTYGRLILYPFTLLATYAHEMGHGLTAVMLGGEFVSLQVFPDGSGLATTRGNFGRLTSALISAGGLVGPSVAGAVVLVLSRRASNSPFLLLGLGLILLASAILVVSNPFGIALIGGIGALVLVGSPRLSKSTSTFLVQLIGVQLCVALFRDIDYMFSPGGFVDGVHHPSDTAAIAKALFLPYWLWGGLIAAFSAAVLLVAVRYALFGQRQRAA